MKIGKLSYNGKTAESLGVFVSGAGTYNAAEEDVTAYEVPGRSGDILISNNRYRNIDVTYPAFIPSDFEERVQAIRNWMRSARSYARIEDNYDLLHFRMGVGKDILSFSPAQQNRAANCQLVFNCKPQRFLYSGEEDFTPGEWGPTETLSGDIVSFENDGNKAFKSLTLPLSPVQSFNGYDRPWPGGAGKNKLEVTLTKTTRYGVTFANNNDGTVSAVGTATANAAVVISLFTPPPGTYRLNGNTEGVSATTYRMKFRVDGGRWFYINSTADSSQITVDGSQTIEVDLEVISGQTVNGVLWKPMLRLATETDPAFEPYANICPISGWTGANVTVSPTTTGGTVYPVTWNEAGTVYGGEVDIVSGELTVTHEAKTVGQTSRWSDDLGNMIYYVSIAAKAKGMLNVISDRYFTPPTTTRPVGSITGSNKTNAVYFATSYPDLATFRQEEANTMFVYPLETPQTYQLTPTQVMTLLGVNNVWSDTGTVEAEIGDNPNVLANPTIFDARPLITLKNPEAGATVTIGEYTLTCLEAYSGTVTIDCENENIYSGPQNLNNKWSGSFPVLKPGNNPVSISGATGTIKPRWWEL